MRSDGKEKCNKDTIGTKVCLIETVSWLQIDEAEQRPYDENDVRSHMATYIVRGRVGRGTQYGLCVNCINSGRGLRHERQIESRMYIGGGLSGESKGSW